jgi:major membrane immunogen (membrane-anchored lipoprotein)
VEPGKYKNKIWLVFLALVSLASCEKNVYSLNEGYYTAEAAEFDSSGWKDYLTISVSGGKIILAEFDAYNSSGFLKSWDMDYMRLMNAADKTYPNAYTRYYSSQFLDKQGVEGIDALPGAAEPFLSFKELAEAVLESARTGDRKTVFVRFKEFL